MLGMFLMFGAACGAACTASRTKRTLLERFTGDVVVAEENAEREFVDSMRRTVSRIH
jgi:hypothetical protein